MLSILGSEAGKRGERERERERERENQLALFPGSFQWEKGA